MTQVSTDNAVSSADAEHPAWVRALPGYTKSLLKIGLPVAAVLAMKRVPLSEVLEITTGTIIQFEKQCDEPLVLEIRNRPIAEGEAVKVGEKFGIRIATMTPPEERFHAVQRRGTSVATPASTADEPA